MSRYTPKHSARTREREAAAPLTRVSRLWAAIAAGWLVGLVALVIATSGGWEQAMRSFSGRELKEQEEELRSNLTTPPQEATQSPEVSSP